MLTKQDILDQRELTQDDLISVLDGLEQEFITRICQVIVDRFQILLDKHAES